LVKAYDKEVFWWFEDEIVREVVVGVDKKIRKAYYRGGIAGSLDISQGI